jgi:lauroyl/myristoyl acyltransferase
VYHDGPGTLAVQFDLGPEGQARLRDLLKTHGGAVIAVPHNVGAVLSAVGLSHSFPTLVLAKNPTSQARTAMAQDVFERMGVEALLVRGGNAMELSRTCLKALRGGKLLVATLDNRYEKKNAIRRTIFGVERGFAPWAVRFAARCRVPVIPAYLSIDRDCVVATLGEPLIDTDLEALTEHYVRFFERKILEDPGSWAFLGDRRWAKVLREACAKLDATPDTA